MAISALWLAALVVVGVLSIVPYISSRPAHLAPMHARFRELSMLQQALCCSLARLTSYPLLADLQHALAVEHGFGALLVAGLGETLGVAAQLQLGLRALAPLLLPLRDARWLQPLLVLLVEAPASTAFLMHGSILGRFAPLTGLAFAALVSDAATPAVLGGSVAAELAVIGAFAVAASNPGAGGDFVSQVAIPAARVLASLSLAYLVLQRHAVSVRFD